MKSDLEKISYANPPQKIFRNIKHYKRVRAAITKALATGNPSRKSNGQSSYLINRLVVKFSVKFREEEVFIDYANGRVTLEAPKKKSERKEHLQERRLGYLTQMLRSVDAMTTIGISHIYLVLDDEGRQELDKFELKQKRGGKK